MGSTIRSVTQPVQPPSAAIPLRWRSWPLADHLTWSWLVPLGVLMAGSIVFWMGGGWFLALAASAALFATMWQFVLPVTFEMCSLGLRRIALRRVRLVPWQAIGSYQLRPGGVIFFQQRDPTKLDLLNSLFVPYPHDADEMLVAVRLYLPHAVELP